MRSRHYFAFLTRHKLFCCALPGILLLALRILLLPVWPIPLPAIYDEFGYLLAADTFSHGRLTNPPHPHWQFFESVYILQQPTYMTKYPPAQGLVMALGQTLFGHPWYGVALSCALLSMALCWALQAWFPTRWALLGAALGLQVCFFDYWMNSYWGGAVTAIGGALALGAWRRITHRKQARFGSVLGLGAVILVLSRPFEGALLLAALLGSLLWRDRRLSVWAPILLIGAAGACWLAFDNYKVTGHPLRLPYQEYVSQYETVPQFNILPVDPVRRNYHHPDLEWLDKGWLTEAWSKARSVQFPAQRLKDWLDTLRTFFGGTLPVLLVLIFAPLGFRSRRTRFPALLAVLIFAATLIEVPQYSHYPAPFMAAFFVLAVQSLRHVRHASGDRIFRATITLLFLWTLYKDATAIASHTTPDHFRAAVARKGDKARDLAAQAPGRHVVFVHYTRFQDPHEEWIYNSADIDGQDVIWAQDMGPEKNRELIEYYKGRAFWRFEPDESFETLIPYQQ